MKNKVILLITGVAVVTLSFTFATSKNQTKANDANSTAQTTLNNEPVGGFASEDKK